MSAESDGPRFHEIRRLEDPCLPAYLRLFETAFPPEERDPVASVVALLGERARGGRDDDHLLAMFEKEDEFVGLAHYLCHSGDDAAYLPYLAVIESRRGAGLGGQLFLEVARRLRIMAPPPRAMIFEVEDPDIQPEGGGALAKRRIGFYERLGAQLLGGIEYVQRVEFCPEGIPMRLMVLPLQEITPGDACRMACDLFGDAVSRAAEPLRLGL